MHVDIRSPALYASSRMSNPPGSKVSPASAPGLIEKVLSPHLPTITFEALMTANASSPTLGPRSSTASLVIDEVTTTPPPMSIRTCSCLTLRYCDNLTIEMIAGAELHEDLSYQGEIRLRQSRRLPTALSGCQ